MPLNMTIVHLWGLLLGNHVTWSTKQVSRTVVVCRFSNIPSLGYSHFCISDSMFCLGVFNEKLCTFASNSLSWCVVKSNDLDLFIPNIYFIVTNTKVHSSRIVLFPWQSSLDPVCRSLPLTDLEKKQNSFATANHEQKQRSLFQGFISILLSC